MTDQWVEHEITAEDHPLPAGTKIRRKDDLWNGTQFREVEKTYLPEEAPYDSR